MARTCPSTSSTLITSTSPGAVITAYPFTVSWWVYLDNESGLRVHWCWGNSAGTQRNTVWSSTQHLVERMNNITGLDINSIMTPDTWHHIAYSASGSGNGDRFFVVNGTKYTSTNTSYTLNSSVDRFSVGISNRSTIEFPLSVGTLGAENNRIADLGIWDVALTEAECARIHLLRCSPEMIRPHSLVSYYILNDGAGDAVDKFGRNLIKAGSPLQKAHPPIAYRPRPTFIFTGAAGAPPAAVVDPMMFHPF